MKFRLLARVYFEREADRKLIPPELNGLCPTECVNSVRYYNPQRSKYCSDCPHKIERDSFREHAEETVFETMGACGFNFDKTLSRFYSIRNLEDVSRDKVSAYSAAFLNVYFSEKRRFEAIKDAERKTS